MPAQGAQQAFETYGWISVGEMPDGLGLAETTPGSEHAPLRAQLFDQWQPFLVLGRAAMGGDDWTFALVEIGDFDAVDCHLLHDIGLAISLVMPGARV